MDNTNQMLDLAAIYGIPPCPGGDCTESPPGFTGQIPEPINFNSARQPSQTVPQMPVMPQTGAIPAVPQFPTIPQTGAAAPSIPQRMQGTNPYIPITPITQPMPVSAESLQYLNGFIRTQIGRNIRVQLLIGTNTLVDKTGTLLAVGANYILLNETNTDDILSCDFYNIKFITFYY